MYDSPYNEDKFLQPGNHNTGEYIHFYNPTNLSIDMSGWLLRGTEYNEQYRFPAGTFLQSKSSLLLVYATDANSFDISRCYNINTGATKILYQKAIILCNKGESLQLYNAAGKLVDAVVYGYLIQNSQKNKYAHNGIQNSYNGLMALQRSQVSYKDDALISLGNEDLTYGGANPGGQGIAGYNNTTPIIPNVDTDPTILTPPITPVFPKPIAWFKTTALSQNMNGNYGWKDISKNNLILQLYNSDKAATPVEYSVDKSKVRFFNFNPAIDLSEGDNSKEIEMNQSNLSQSTIIGVWGPNDNVMNTNQFVFALNGRAKESVVFTKNTVYSSVESNKPEMKYGEITNKNLMFQNNSIDGTENKYKEQSLRTSVFFRATKPNNEIWGENTKATISLGKSYSASNRNNTSTFSSEVIQLTNYTGYSPELLIFDRILNPLECNIFESYLAIKYGLSLDNSYVSAKGLVVWNYNSNLNYNNRITGYGREDNIGLNQKISTTTYEEIPYNYNNYSSFQDGDPYKSPSGNKLLVIGCQSGNTLNDGDYILFGDNNASYKTTANIASISEINAIMDRKWLLQTNRKTNNTSRYIDWNTSLQFNKNDFQFDLVKPNTSGTGYAITSVALKSKDGYLGWVSGSTVGEIIVKFGTNTQNLQATKHDYGYKITNTGEIIKVIRGVTDPAKFTNIHSGQKIEIYKTEKICYLVLDGIRNQDSEIEIESDDLNKEYFGAVSINSNQDVILKSFRYGGFSDTGHRLELSYDTERAAMLSDYANGKCYLLIDRSGTGNFGSNTVKILSDEYDALRKKIIFNNVFWEPDGNNNSVVFTFGYLKANTSFGMKKKTDDSDIAPNDNNYGILVYYKDLNKTNEVSVKVYLENSSPSIIMLYDIAGRRILTKEFPATSDVQVTDIVLPYPGVFTIKVVTENEQYVQKVISKNQ